MSNRDLIKYAHVLSLAVLLACGVWAVTGKAGIMSQNQNQNSNQNSNQNWNHNTNQNTNTGNANRSHNQNMNMSGNRNSRNAKTAGEHTGMRSLRSQDRNFLMDAAMSGMMEVELGRLASERGASDAVKQFGERMVTDHTAANTELMTLASNKGITLPTTLEKNHQNEVTRLSSMSGAEFDRAYARMMLNAHAKDVRMFERESTRGADADLKAFASKTLPILMEHLQMARALPGNERGNTNANSGGARNTNRNSNRNNNGNTNRNNNGNTNRNNNGNGNPNRP